ncbi:MAG: hypothetical protein G01um101416_599 [Microgenomates group bacterium Gr01-1014_16]|nr:MAG: hypothetical protein G01um101416_599 [Microgenomates group bacterium Gr01-1014_16]
MNNQPPEPEAPRINHTLRQQLRLMTHLAVYGLAYTTETVREVALKGQSTYNNVPAIEPIITAPENSPLWHVGNLPDAYFGTAAVYVAVLLLNRVLPEQIKKYFPENVRLALAFTVCMATFSLVERNDPADIPAAFIGSALFIATHLASAKLPIHSKQNPHPQPQTESKVR